MDSISRAALSHVPMSGAPNASWISTMNSFAAFIMHGAVAVSAVRASDAGKAQEQDELRSS